MVEDFVMFPKGGEWGCEGACEEFGFLVHARAMDM